MSEGLLSEQKIISLVSSAEMHTLLAGSKDMGDVRGAAQTECRNLLLPFNPRYYISRS